MNQTKIVLMKNSNGTETPLGLYFKSTRECEQDISWQNIGGFDISRMRIASRAEVKEANLENGIFTKQAWEEFLKNI